ncbi:hypothetical protein [Bdellovibrio sp. HCB2-146]|uniref:hypothetical protein n=1 Tax=Bdellovibrio sp. HCB2-146 TaxID=3394362 RepID=UPI0039BC853A
MLKKLILAAIALFLVFAGGLILMAGYVLNNPESVFSAFTKVTNKFVQGEAYKENEEFLLQGIKTLKIDTRSVKIELVPYDDSTLKVVLEGEIPRFERGPFLNQEAIGEDLIVTINEPLASQWISVNVNGEEYAQGTDSKLTAKVYYPSSYKGHITVETKDGPVHVKVPETVPFEVELNSATGKIANKVDASKYVAPADGIIGKITVRTEAGDVSAD